MATDNAWIVIAQAEAGHTEVAPADAAHTTETTGEANLEHAESGMPQLDPAIFPNLIFWLVVALFALYWVLSRMALPRIGTVIGERNDAIANDIEAAASLKRRAEEAEAAYNAALAQARDEAHRIAAEARAGIDKELAALMAKADAGDRRPHGRVRDAHRRDPRQRRRERRAGRPRHRRGTGQRAAARRRRPGGDRRGRRQPAEGLTPWGSSTTPRSSSRSAS